MAEEKVAQPPPKKGGIIFKIAIMFAILVVAAIGGFVTYRFVLAPIVMAPAEVAATPVDEDAIPLTPVMVDLPENYVNVIMENKDLPASTLLYSVTFECKNQETADLITAHLPRFIDMVSKLHDSRLRAELDDIQAVKSSIQREARQKANALLERIEAKPVEDVEVTNVFHRTLMVDDKL